MDMIERQLVEGTISSPVFFVCTQLGHRWPELLADPNRLRFADVSTERLGNNGQQIWIVSTYLRLRERGATVRISGVIEPNAINVCTEREVLSHPAADRAFIAAVSADRMGITWGDYQIVQSPEQLRRGQPMSLIEHWPQPGLISRDANRGNLLERVGYVGPRENLAAAYQTEAFRQQLAEMGVEFVIRDDPAQWHDFSDLDGCLAVRDWPWQLIRTKPATKLVHAWLTGAIGLMGPEPSYRYWGEEGRDYFEVSTPKEAVEVIRRLKDNHALCHAVRQSGFAKGRAHDEEAVCRQWEAMLTGPVRATFEQWQKAGRTRWALRAARRRVQRMQAMANHRVFQLRARGWRGLKRGLARRLGTSG